MAIAVMMSSCGVAGLVSTPSEYVSAGKRSKSCEKIN